MARTRSDLLPLWSTGSCRAVSDDPAVLHLDYAVGCGSGRRVVGDEEDGHTGSPDALEQLERPASRSGIQAPGRLVHEEQARVVGEGPGDRHALTFPARQLRRTPVLTTFELDLGEQLKRSLAAGPVGPGHGDLDVGEHGLLGNEVVQLENDAHFLATEPAQIADPLDVAACGGHSYKMNLELTKEQAEELADLLDSSLRDLSSEIADTDNPGYRAKLVARRERFAEVTAALGALLRPDGPLLESLERTPESLEQELSHPGG